MTTLNNTVTKTVFAIQSAKVDIELEMSCLNYDNVYERKAYIRLSNKLASLRVSKRYLLKGKSTPEVEVADLLEDGIDITHVIEDKNMKFKPEDLKPGLLKNTLTNALSRGVKNGQIVGRMDGYLFKVVDDVYLEPVARHDVHGYTLKTIENYVRSQFK